MRFIAIALISIISIMPFEAVLRFLGVPIDYAIGITLFLSFVCVPILLLKIWTGTPFQDVIPVNQNCIAMKKYTQIAQENMPRFLSGLAEGRLEASAKFPLKIKGSVEHLWGVAHAQKGESIVVSSGGESIISSLGLHPAACSSHDDFQRMVIPIKDIEDWVLRDADGTFYGGYTLLVMTELYQEKHGRLPTLYADQLDRFVDLQSLREETSQARK